MEKIKTLILFCSMLIPEFIYCQNSGSASFVRKGLMDVAPGLTVGVMTFNPVQEIYFSGSFSYCFENQIAARTDLNIFLPDYNFEG